MGLSYVCRSMVLRVRVLYIGSILCTIHKAGAYKITTMLDRLYFYQSSIGQGSTKPRPCILTWTLCKTLVVQFILNLYSCYASIRHGWVITRPHVKLFRSTSQETTKHPQVYIMDKSVCMTTDITSITALLPPFCLHADPSAKDYVHLVMITCLCYKGRREHAANYVAHWFAQCSYLEKKSEC